MTPRDLCPLGHGPMWWWPSGGTWACQRPECEVTTPTDLDGVRLREQWQRDYLLPPVRTVAYWRAPIASPKAFPFPINTA